MLVEVPICASSHPDVTEPATELYTPVSAVVSSETEISPRRTKPK
jgi:hypothetical protein